MDKNNFVWVALILFSLFAFVTGRFDLTNALFIALLLATTFIKAFLVIEHFMNLSKVQVKYRLIPTAWLSIVTTLIAVAYYA